MSPRAAARLESIGFAAVYDYVAGKADWGAAGLPLEGESPSSRRAGAFVQTDFPTCRLGDRLRDVSAQVAAAGRDECFVIGKSGVLLGRLGRSALGRADDAAVEEAMTDGPSTVRPSARLERMVERMRRRGLSDLPVTTSDGRLVGLLIREEAERALR